MKPAPATAGDGTSIAAILQAVRKARAARPAVPLALATLVNVEGSSYRQPGARVLMDAEQRVLAGAISGGCLEGDVAARAQQVCATGEPVLLRYDLREDLETIWGFGSGCDGIAHVLLEPLGDDSWLRRAHDAMLARTRPVLVTTFASNDASVAVGGHELVPGMAEHGLAEYGVSDAAPDGRAASTSASRVADTPDHVRIPLLTGHVYVGVETRGAITRHVLSEPLDPPIALHLIGAGKTAEAFATIGAAMGWHVTVIDHREALLAAMTLPAAAGRQSRRASAGLGHLPMDNRTVIALLTHIFEVDAAWLAALLPQQVAYIGVLGSRNRAARLIEQLVNDGTHVSAEMQDRLFAPIGLDLGGESPESIALAGIAEMEAVLHARPGGFLRARQNPIHTRTPVPMVLPDSLPNALPDALPSAMQDAIDATVEHCVIPRDERA